MRNLIAYTDGACTLNTTDKNGNSYGNGGYGLVIMENDNIIYTYNQGSHNTTNNAEELKGIAAAINFCKKTNKKFQLQIYSDSAYCVNIFSGPTWAKGWEKNNWTRAKNQPIKNLKLVKFIWEDVKKGNITISKVKGHSSNIYNNMADQLAVEAKMKISNI